MPLADHPKPALPAGMESPDLALGKPVARHSRGELSVWGSSGTTDPDGRFCGF